MKDPFAVDTEIRMFGSPGKSKVVKAFAESKPTPGREYADRFKALGEMTNGYGGTCDAEPFWNIASSIGEDAVKELQAGKAKEFIFEITDGGANAASKYAQEGAEAWQDSRNAIAAAVAKGARGAKEMGVIARGFQVGTPSEEDQATFKAIWEADGARIPEPKDLVQAVAQLLASKFEQIPIGIEYYPAEDEE